MIAEELQQILELLTMTIANGNNSKELLSMLHVVLHTLHSASLNDATLVSNRIVQLLALWEALPDDEVLRHFISTQMSSFVAFGVEQVSDSEEIASEWSATVEERWKLARRPLAKPIVEAILKLIADERLGVVEVLSPCVYKTPAVRLQLATSILSETSVFSNSFASLQCLIEASIPEDLYLPRLCKQFAHAIVKRALRATGQRNRESCERTLRQLFRLYPDKQALFPILSQQYSKMEDTSGILVVRSLTQSGFLTPSEIGTLLSSSTKHLIAFLGNGQAETKEFSSVMSAVGKSYCVPFS